MTSWIILLIKQYIDIINYLVIGNSIFKIKYEKHKKIREIKNFIFSNLFNLCSTL